jgi:hypothetical protein
VPTRLLLDVERSATGHVSGTITAGGGGAGLPFSGALALLACLEMLVLPGSALGDGQGDGDGGADRDGQDLRRSVQRNDTRSRSGGAT